MRIVPPYLAPELFQGEGPVREVPQGPGMDSAELDFKGHIFGLGLDKLLAFVPVPRFPVRSGGGGSGLLVEPPGRGPSSG